jgi:hypothetical protein
MFGAYMPQFGPTHLVLRDLGPYSRHGTIVGTPPWVIGGNARLPGYVLSLDATDVVNIDNAMVAHIDTLSTWSAVCWMYVDTALASGFFGHGDWYANGQGFCFYRDASAKLNFTIDDSGVPNSSASTLEPANVTWHQYGCIVDRNANYQAAMNGSYLEAPQDISDKAAGTINNADAMKLGDIANIAIGPFNGLWGGVQFYEGLLLPQEIALLHVDPLAVFRRSTVSLRAAMAGPVGEEGGGTMLTLTGAG